MTLIVLVSFDVSERAIAVTSAHLSIFMTDIELLMYLTFYRRTNFPCFSAVAVADPVEEGLSFRDCLAAASARAFLAFGPGAAGRAYSGCLASAGAAGRVPTFAVATSLDPEVRATRAACQEEAPTATFGSAAVSEPSSKAFASPSTADGFPPPALRRRQCWRRSYSMSKTIITYSGSL